MNASNNTPNPLQRNNQSAPARPDKAWMRYLESATGKRTHYDSSSKLSHKGTVYLLMDCSKSMAFDDKMWQGQRGAVKFAKEACEKRYAVGVISFSTTAQEISGATRSINDIESCVRQMRAEGSTNLTDALQLSVKCLSSVIGERLVCVITDGYPDDAPSALSAAKEAAAQGIDVMALGTDDADEKFLRSLVTRRELQAQVATRQLEQGVAAMAKLLPGVSAD